MTTRIGGMTTEGLGAVLLALTGYYMRERAACRLAEMPSADELLGQAKAVLFDARVRQATASANPFQPNTQETDQ